MKAVVSLKDTRLRKGAQRIVVNGRDGHEHSRLDDGAISGVSTAIVLDSRQREEDSQVDTITFVRFSPVELEISTLIILNSISFSRPPPLWCKQLRI